MSYAVYWSEDGVEYEVRRATQPERDAGLVYASQELALIAVINRLEILRQTAEQSLARARRKQKRLGTARHIRESS